MGFLRKNKENDCTKFIYTNETFPLKYNIKHTTNLIINNIVYNETDTHIEWRIDKWQADNDGYEISIISEKHDILKYPLQMKGLVGFLSKLNLPFSKLNLKLNQQGLPVSVINQKEIYDKWDDLKQNDFAACKDDPSMKNVILGGDNDFRNSLSVINNSLIYVIFLAPVFGGKKITTPKLRTFTQRSQLFGNSDINIVVNEKMLAESNLDIKLEHRGIGELREYNKAEKIFKESYKQISNSSFNYSYIMKVHYNYFRDGVLKQCIAEIKEQANDLVITKETYNINLMQ